MVTFQPERTPNSKQRKIKYRCGGQYCNLEALYSSCQSFDLKMHILYRGTTNFVMFVLFLMGIKRSIVTGRLRNDTLFAILVNFVCVYSVEIQSNQSLDKIKHLLVMDQSDLAVIKNKIRPNTLILVMKFHKKKFSH